MRSRIACAHVLASSFTLAGALACGSQSSALPVSKPENAEAATSRPKPRAVTEDGTEASRENAVIAKMLARVAKLRGLEVKRPVKGKRLDRAELIGKIRSKVAKEVPPEVVTLEADSLKLYGFIPLEMDYLETTMKLLEAQLAGFYEPLDEHMYLAGDLDGLNGEVTLAHELQHALQDQHFDLKQHSGYRPGRGDEQAAFSALAEGDATSVMIDFTMAKMKTKMNAASLDEAMLEEQIAGGVEADEATKNIPHIMKADLVAPYVYGTRFVNALRRKGGFDLVNRAFARPPASTEHILHPEKWEASEAPIKVDAPPAPDGTWKRVDDDTTGELGFALAFTEWTTKTEGFRLAEGWGGDRDATYVRGEEIANITRLEYDPGAASAAGDAQVRLAASLGRSAIRDKAFACLDRPKLGPLAFASRGTRLVFVAGPAKRGAPWAASATCRDVGFRRWVTAALDAK